MDAGLLQETIQSLKDVGAWDTLERIAVEDCKVLEYGVALDAVGEGEVKVFEFVKWRLIVLFLADRFSAAIRPLSLLRQVLRHSLSRHSNFAAIFKYQSISISGITLAPDSYGRLSNMLAIIQ